MKISYLYWPVTFFSTAFGAGIFFLPQAVGPNLVGTNMFLLLMISAAIVSCLAHILFFQFITAYPQNDYRTSASLFIGKGAATIVCFLFLLSMLLIILINFMTLVNLIDGFYGGGLKNRFLISCIGVTILSTVSFLCNKEIEKLLSKVSVISIGIVFFLSLFFLFSSKGDVIPANIPETSVNIVPLLSIILFAFNFSPCIQRFAKTNNDRTKSRKKIIIGIVFIFFFIFLTVVSLSKALSIQDIFLIQSNNVDSLTYASGLADNYSIWMISAILIAVVTSGAYTGTLMGVVDSAASLGIKNRALVMMANGIVCIAAGTMNPSILKIIAGWSTPVIIATVFLIPSLYCIKKEKGALKISGFFVGFCGVAVFFLTFL
jgi:serine transporter